MAAKTREPYFVSQDEGKRLSVFADTITIKVSSERTNGAYSISEDITPPGAGSPRHVHHREDEMFYVVEGEYEFQCADRVFKAAKGHRSIFQEISHTPSRTQEILREEL
ncbi:MAG: cupin domain-containing protein [Candidatus Bathyarchaeia archaeon]